MKNFFAWQPKGDFHYFSFAHILAVIIGLMFIFVLCYFLRKSKHKNVRITLIVIMMISFSLDIIYWVWEYVKTGSVNIKSSLPLYYCSLFYMVLPFAVVIKNKKVNEIALSYLATFNLIAGLMGLIINTNLNVYPVFSFVGVRSLVYHFLMIFTSVFIWVTRYYVPNIHHTYSFIAPLAIMFTPALLVDIYYKTDYFYLNGGVGTPIEIISNCLPKFIYIPLLYLVIMCIVNLIFFMPTIYKHFKYNKLNK